MIGANLTEADWLAQKRAEVEDLLPPPGDKEDAAIQAWPTPRKVAQPNYAALGIADPEGQN